MSGISNMSRRDFLKTGALAGGGLILCFSFPLGKALADTAGQPAALVQPNAFIRIGADDTVTIIVNHSEMGQGLYTSLPMLVAEELEADWTKIRVEPAPVDPVYNHTAYGTQMTGGSSSVWSEYDRLRQVGAAAREMLLAAAAAVWQVDRASCRAENGKVIHTSGRQLTFGKLADKAAAMAVPKQIRLKEPAEFKIIGKPTLRLDSLEKVNGTAVFGLDVRIPGMLVALIARPPVFGAKVANIDSRKTRAVSGIRKVVQIPSGVAVVATGFWSAKKGRDALKITWNEGPGAKLSTEGMRLQYAKLAKTPGTVARREGDPDQALLKAAKQITAEYEVPYLAHATMETLNCVIDLRADGCDIHTGTQFQTVDRDSAARVLGLNPEKIKIHTTFLGGGFGRRANPQSDFVVEAAHVAKAVKKPVKVIWTREDDIQGGYYRPIWSDRLSAGLDKDGRPVAWLHTIVGQSIMRGSPFEKMMIGKDGIDPTSVEGAQEIAYAIPNIRVDLHSPANEVPVQWWRSVGHSHTAFVVESFIDELAHASGQDPYLFRRNLLAGHPRHLGVLELAADKAGWGKPLPRGRGRGIAVHESFKSFIAQVAEVSVSPEGEVRVHRVVCAVDCGKYVNPATIEAQMESGIVFGLTATIHGAITLKDGRVEQSNFHDYQMARINAMPEVEVHIVRNGEKPGGIGEPGVPPIAPAICNAIFSLTGKRIRSLPIRVEELKA
jgi:isoquinoline 1-oxidoreductase subunit beta